MIDIAGTRFSSIGGIIHVGRVRPQILRYAFRVVDLRTFYMRDDKLVLITAQTDITIPTTDWTSDDYDLITKVLTQLLIEPTTANCERLI